MKIPKIEENGYSYRLIRSYIIIYRSYTYITIDPPLDPIVVSKILLMENHPALSHLALSSMKRN